MDRILTGAWRINAWLARAARGGVVVLAGVMVASIVWQVVTRAVFNRSPPWTEEVALLMFTWIVLLMVALCAREHLHVRIDLLVSALPRRVAPVLERLIAFLIGAIGAYLVWSGSSYLMEMRGATSQAIKYPSWLLNAAMPVSATLLFAFSFENAARGPGERD